MDIELVKESQLSYRKPYSWVLLVLIVTAILPSGMEQQQILLLLFATVIPAAYFSDRSNKINLLLASLIALMLLLVNYGVFKLHLWQLTWEWSQTEGLFGWLIRIDPFLHSIPFNDGMWLRQFRTPAIDSVLIPVYSYGFTVPLFVLVVYFVLSHRPDKILHVLFATHALQYILILPFHFWVDGHQVWVVQNVYEGTTFMDPLIGHRTYGVPTVPSLNHVFPSMHTSIATAMIMVAWRERSALLKWAFVIFNVLVIISTVYLGIHWVVDVIGGVIFGWAVVKLADWIMKREKVRNFLVRIEEYTDTIIKVNVKRNDRVTKI